MDPAGATRPIMWNISPPWLMYAMAAIAVGIFAYGVWEKISFWRRGKPSGERLTDFGKRFWYLGKEILLQTRVRREGWQGWFHSLIFYSFLVLALTTAIVAIDYDLGTSFFRGYVYLFFSAAADLAGLLILVGVSMAAWRRYVKPPASVETTFADTWALVLIGLMVLTGFLVEGLRIATAGDAWRWVSPVGVVFSLPFLGISESGGRTLHAVLWWTHTVFALSWIASIPYTKFVHLLSLPTNLFFAKLAPRGSLQRFDIEALMSSEDFKEEEFSLGIAEASDLTWKQRLDLDACISCGRCEDICPATQAGLEFSPRQLVANLKTLVHENGRGGNHLDGTRGLEVAAAGESQSIVGKAFDEEYVWNCRTCMACMEVCPAAIDHVDTLIEIRRNEVSMQGRVPSEAARALKMLETHGNPFGAQENRVDWLRQLEVRMLGAGEQCDVLFWIGCATTFDPTKQKIAADLASLFDRCGIDFAVLGQDETCCGDPARVIGREDLFQQVAKATVEALNSRKFRVLVTCCPHCYNVLKNEYPQFGGHYNVIHHSEFLHEMLWTGSLTPLRGKSMRAVYHDPCYLGRYQKIYDSPREVLRTSPGFQLVEMRSYRDRSMCCGGGGGHYWMDIKKGERLNNRRVEQAKEAGADTIITSCAYCMQMLEDSVKMMDLDEKIRVDDIATVVLRSLA